MTLQCVEEIVDLIIKVGQQDDNGRNKETMSQKQIKKRRKEMVRELLAMSKKMSKEQEIKFDLLRKKLIALSKNIGCPHPRHLN